MKSAINAADFERMAKRRLPRMVYDAIAGGATDEVTVRANREAFQRVWLRPRPLATLSEFDMSTTVLGQRIDFPVLLAPTGMARMCHPEAEAGVARAAGRSGTIFAVSSAASQTLEEVAEAVSDTPQGTNSLWYQLYVRDTREETLTILERAKEAGYRVLCVTIDGGVSQKRERDIRNGLTIPIRMSPKLILAGISRPMWTKNFLFGTVGRVRGNTGQGSYAFKATSARFAAVITRMKMPTWDDLKFLRDNWEGPVVVKGIGRRDEVSNIIDIGVAGIVVSNHGGRNLDAVRPSLEVLPEVVEAADGRAEIYLDGGIRRGTDVVKALALGARAVLIGRPYMWALAVGGSTGVESLLTLLKHEVQGTMGFCGLPTIGDIDATAIHIGSSFDRRVTMYDEEFAPEH